MQEDAGEDKEFSNAKDMYRASSIEDGSGYSSKK
jgi:hypothetical protein